MTDILLLLGAALCVLSVPAAIWAVLQTRAPRLAALLLVAGIVLLALCAWQAPGSVGVPQLQAAWARLLG